MSPIRTISLAAAAAALLAAGEAGAQRQVNARHDASPTGRVEINLNSGSLRVVGWGRNEVQVTGSLARESDRVVLEGSGRTTEVRVSGRGRAGHATLEVRVPAGSSVNVVTTAAPITISGVNGAVETMARSGATIIQGSPRTVDATGQQGGITFNGESDRVVLTSMAGPVNVSGTVRQRVEISSLAGPVDVTGNVGEAEIHSMNGAVRVANVTGGRVEINAVAGSVNVTGTRLRGNVETVSGSVVLSGSLGGPLDVSSHAGSVELRLPGSTAAEVTVTTFSGDVDSAWRLRREGREWHGTLGRGGPSLSISTFSGSVKLTRR